MIPPPIALGLNLCEKVIVEEGTKNVTLVNTFTTMFVNDFPSTPQRFAVYAVLTDGQGDAIIDLVLTHLETDNEIHVLRAPFRFSNRLAEARVFFRMSEISFPESGKYQFSLLVDGDWITQRQFQVRKRGI